MVKKRKRKRRNGKKIPLAASLGLMAGMIQPLNHIMAGNLPNAMQTASMAYTGYDPYSSRFDIEYLKAGAVPLIAGAIISTLAAKSGINRRLNIPFIKM